MGVFSIVKHSQLAFYCDFDGTISERDMVGVILRRFAPPEAERIVAEVNAKRRTVQDGVEAMFGLIPSSVFPDMEQYAREQTKLRPGFDAFVALCREKGWRLTVVSGGFDFFVHPVVAAYRDVVQVYCNSLDATGAYLKVKWGVPCDTACDGGCGLCKPTVIRNTLHAGETLVVIGDGVTDVKQAKLADFVFARDKLLAECEALGLPHAKFETFYDIARHSYLAVEEA